MAQAENFADRLATAVQKSGNPCVIGLDPRPALFPECLRPKSSEPRENASKILLFNQKIIDIAAPFVPVVKPQIAFYERFGPPGYEAYEKTIVYAHEKGLLVIGDVKRGDIGSTAEAYAEAHLGEGSHYADAITLNPFFGSDGVQPFLDLAKKRGKGLFFLVRTSNPSSAEIQGIHNRDGESVSEKIGSLVNRWGSESIGKCGYSSVGAVVGATHPQEIATLRKRLPKAIFLLPGYGSQGGQAKDLRPAFDQNGFGALVSSSRGVLFAYRDPKFQGEKSWEAACEKAARQMIADVQGLLS